MPFVYPGSPWVKDLKALLSQLGVPVLLGIPRMERTVSGYQMFNSVLAFSAKGELLGAYDKEHLVPFGEYVPWVRYFPWLKRLSVASGDYQAGRGPGLLKVAGHRLGILICFENVFPELSRKRVKEGAEVLIVLTNDAWFGTSSALPQHFYQSVLRAVENRRFVIQVSNTGLSGLIDPYGRVLSVGPLNQEWLACWGRSASSGLE